MSKRILSLLIGAALLMLTACAAPAAPAPAAEGEATEAPAEEAADAGEAAGEQIIIGGFDVGPGGAPEAVLYMSGAGHNWYAKMFTPLVMQNADYTEFGPEGGLADQLGSERRRHGLDL